MWRKYLVVLIVLLFGVQSFGVGIEGFAEEAATSETKANVESKLVSSVNDGVLAENKESKTKVIVHYNPKDQASKAWQMWVWNNDGVAGHEVVFEDTNAYGDYSKVAVIDAEGVQEELGFLIKNGSGWGGDRDIPSDRYIKTKDGITEVWLEFGKEEMSAKPANLADLPSHDNLDVTFYYHRDDKDYSDWFVHSWAEGATSTQKLDFKDGQSDGEWQSVKANFSGVSLSNIGFTIARDVNGAWEKDGTEDDRMVYLFTDDGKAEVWIVSGDKTNYRNPNFADVTKQIKTASLASFREVKVTLNRDATALDLMADVTLTEDGNAVAISNIRRDATNPAIFYIETAQDLPIQAALSVKTNGFGEKFVDTTSIVRNPDFDKKFAYTGTEPLGATYGAEQSVWRLWAPTAASVKLTTYQDNLPNSAVAQSYDMTPKAQGIWEFAAKIPSGTAYTYELVFADGKKATSQDPYAKAATANGNRSVILDPAQMVPANWETSRMPAFTNPTDAIIYEMHVRDFSIANKDTVHKGKYLGVIEEGTKTANGDATGIDYLKNLGITHVQILPMFDYASLDEEKHQSTSEQLGAFPYNWGYDPKNYNVPEGSYSTNPYNPVTRIHEAKQMVQGLHNNGLRVIMDVVYNHVYEAGAHSFEKTVPGYYFRYGDDGKLSNGTGVGNDTASERAMMRKYMVDSVAYWAKEYHMDGFRFDLMGIHDVDTMNAIKAELNKIDPSIIVLGEGWDLGTPLASDAKANQKNASKMPEIAHFNDSIRDAIKGSTWGGQEAEPGFVNGATGKEELVAKNILAGSLRDQGQGIYDFAKPSQVIQYAEAHDNLTLWDKLSYSNPNDTEADKKKMQKLATDIVLLSQGVPFIHAGQEFFRTKDRDENSYQSSDAINKLDWDRYADNVESVKETQAVMQLRNTEPLFRMTDYAEINQKMKIIKQDENVIAYEMKEAETSYIVIFNANKAEKEIAIPANQYSVRIGETTTNLATKASSVKAPALSTLVLKNGKAMFQIDAKAGVGGTITPNGKQSYNAGEKPSFAVQADAGYRVKQVLVDGKVVMLSGMTYIFDALTAGHTIEVVFETLAKNNAIESLNKISLPLSELQTISGETAKKSYLLKKLEARGYYNLEGDTERHDLDVMLDVANLNWAAPKAGVYEGTLSLASESKARAATTKSVQITLTAAATIPKPGDTGETTPTNPATPIDPDNEATITPPKNDSNIQVGETAKTPEQDLPATGDTQTSLWLILIGSILILGSVFTLFARRNRNN
ncbi:type I pullulanase [Paenilisteria weihenstephanensis]|uniref:type I pullulanase n=1 Tax=Listeria weihenstephanensis TaxID=1006155 RepID=UPI001E367CF6|nr:type I pullulanase [Listeria weihenstephanensis]